MIFDFEFSCFISLYFFTISWVMTSGPFSVIYLPTFHIAWICCLSFPVASFHFTETLSTVSSREPFISSTEQSFDLMMCPSFYLKLRFYLFLGISFGPFAVAAYSLALVQFRGSLGFQTCYLVETNSKYSLARDRLFLLELQYWP